MTKDLAGKNFIITGANTGIGKITAMELARRGAHVIVANRSRAKSEPVIKEIAAATNKPPKHNELDLADLSSVRKAAEQILAKNIPIHGLINNAGMAGTRGKTKDGIEITFGTNHLGHYLFTRLLLDRIKETQGARIVNVASKSHYRAKKIDWSVLRDKTHSTTGLREYEVSKLANVLITKALARTLEGSGVTTSAVHPGVVATAAWRKVPGPVRWIMKKFMVTPEQGAHCSLRTAPAPALAAEPGHYYDADGSEKRPSRLAA